MKIRTKKQLRLISNQPICDGFNYRDGTTQMSYSYIDIVEGMILDVEFETSTFYVVKINGLQYSINKYDAEKIVDQNGKEVNKMKLSLLARKLLDRDIRTLVRAGILNEQLEVADIQYILNFIVYKFKDELALEARKDKKDKEEEKEK
jgi:hypothetical protein